MTKKRIAVVVTDPSSGNSKRIEVTERDYERFFSRAGVQANNISIPIQVRVAHVFKPELHAYFDMVDQGIPKCRAFKEAFRITSDTPLLMEMLEYVREEERKNLRFADLFENLSGTWRYNNMGNPITNVDANNEFYTWWGAQRLKSGIELRVAYVRFMKFTSHLLWDEEFQQQVRAFV